MAFPPPVERVGDEVKVNIFPRQGDFLNATVDDCLYGGAAGGGKSIALLLFAAKRRMEHPGSVGLALRRTFRELENSLILESQKLYPAFGAVYNEQKKRWKFPNGSIQQFGYCERDGDVYQYQSANYDDIEFDELTHFTMFQFTYITSRARSSKTGVKALVRAGSNPGNVGHAWVYKRYIEPSTKQAIWTDPYTKKTMSFISAKIADNFALSENDPNYINRLRELPEKKYLALAEGRWDTFEGAYFPEFGPQNVLPYPRIPDTFTYKFLSLDWGWADPACVLWWEVTPMGRVFIYRELYVTKLDPKELAARILEMSPPHEKYEYVAASPEIWGKTADMKEGGETIQQMLQTGLGDRIFMKKAMNARVEGWMKMREWLGSKAADGRPWLQVSPQCVKLIETIPGAVHDEKHPEDMDQKCEDHAMESCRYGIVSLAQGVPRGTATHPGLNGYERIFGAKPEDGNFRLPTELGRSGYGF